MVRRKKWTIFCYILYLYLSHRSSYIFALDKLKYRKKTTRQREDSQPASRCFNLKEASEQGRQWSCSLHLCWLHSVTSVALPEVFAEAWIATCHSQAQQSALVVLTHVSVDSCKLSKGQGWSTLWSEEDFSLLSSSGPCWPVGQQQESPYKDCSTSFWRTPVFVNWAFVTLGVAVVLASSDFATVRFRVSAVFVRGPVRSGKKSSPNTTVGHHLPVTALIALSARGLDKCHSASW